MQLIEKQLSIILLCSLAVFIADYETTSHVKLLSMHNDFSIIRYSLDT